MDKESYYEAKRQYSEHYGRNTHSGHPSKESDIESLDCINIWNHSTQLNDDGSRSVIYKGKYTNTLYDEYPEGENV